MSWSRTLTRSFIIVWSLTVCACGAEPASGGASQNGIEELRDRDYLIRLAARPVVELTGPEVDLDTLPVLGVGSDQLPFDVPRPSSLDAVGGPFCGVAMGDRRNDAIHLYHLDGTPRGSITGGASAVSYTVDPAGVDLTFSGTVAVMSMNKQKITLADSSGAILRQWSATPTTTAGLAFAEGDVAVLGSETIVDQWFSGWRAAQQDLDWSSQPVLRTFRLEQPKHAGSTLELPYLFASTLSRGMIDAAGDSLWYARMADAVIFGFGVSANGIEMRDSVPLPFAFPAEPPSQGLRNGSPAAARAENHLIDFAVVPGGFVVLQATAYPSPDDVETVRRWRTSRVAIVHYTRTGAVVGALHLEGDYRRIAAADRYAYVIGRHVDAEPFSTRIVRLDGIGVGADPACAN